MQLNLANTLQKLLDDNRGGLSRQQYITELLKLLRDNPNTLAEISAILQEKQHGKTKERSSKKEKRLY